MRFHFGMCEYKFRIQEPQRHQLKGSDLFGIGHVHPRIAEVVVLVDYQRAGHDGER